MVNNIAYNLPDFTTTFFIVTLFDILISSVILYVSVKLVGDEANIRGGDETNIRKSIYLTTLMELLSIIIPLFSNGILFYALYTIIWLFLIITFFKISVWKAILVALVQVVIAFALIGAVIGNIIVLLNI